MDFANRIKKEMTEGIVRALLADAGYRVIPFGIERVLREVECQSEDEYKNLHFPDAVSRQPDLAVMNRQQDQKFFVEVKYRAAWSNEVLDYMAEQVELFKDLVLVFLVAKPPESRHLKDRPPESKASPSAHLRCCRLRWLDGQCQAEVDKRWQAFDRLTEHVWWGLPKIQDVFKLVEEKKAGADSHDCHQRHQRHPEDWR
jgi:hypothetical protein